MSQKKSQKNQATLGGNKPYSFIKISIFLIKWVLLNRLAEATATGGPNRKLRCKMRGRFVTHTEPFHWRIFSQCERKALKN